VAACPIKSNQTTANREWKLPLECVTVVADKLLKRKLYILMTDGRGLINISFNMAVFIPHSEREWLLTEIFFAPSSNYCWKVLRVDAFYKSWVNFRKVETYCILVPSQLRLELNYSGKRYIARPFMRGWTILKLVTQYSD
jgi:hypothetical protein